MRTAAYFVASAARMASHSARRLASVLAACRSRGWQPGPVLGWSPGGRQGRRMIDGRLTDSTGGRRPVIWFSTYCCAPAEHLPASSNPAFPHPPIGNIERWIGEDVVKTQVLKFVLVEAALVVPADVSVDTAHR